jgi:hypothetical protein
MPYICSLELSCFASELQYHLPIYDISRNDAIVMLEQSYGLLFIHGEHCVNYEIQLTNSTLTYNTQGTEILAKEAQIVSKVSVSKYFHKIESSCTYLNLHVF